MHETTPLEKVKVLYVEDDDNAREALASMLKRRVGRLFTAKNGVEGLELFYTFQPEIIIADLFMPNMGGIEMIRQIKASGYKPFVIITTAVSESNVILDAVDVGIDKYIVKPLDLPALMDELLLMAAEVGKSPGADYTLPFTVLSHKKEFEAAIKKEFSSFLKASTGKGPLDVKVLISDNCLELTAVGVLTPYEKTLLDNFQNIAIIKQNRQLFFTIKGEELRRLIADCLNMDVEVSEIAIDVKRDMNKLIFHWKG